MKDPNRWSVLHDNIGSDGKGGRMKKYRVEYSPTQDRFVIRTILYPWEEPTDPRTCYDTKNYWLAYGRMMVLNAGMLNGNPKN